MADEDNKPLQPTGLLDADAIYVEEVEGEQERRKQHREEEEEEEAAFAAETETGAGEEAQRIVMIFMTHFPPQKWATTTLTTTV